MQSSENFWAVSGAASLDEWAATCAARSSAGYARRSMKTNQDTVVARFPQWFGILDGHGLNGHRLSATAARALADKLKETMDLEAAVLAAEKACVTAKFCSATSGTTLCLVAATERKILVANVGDSVCCISFHCRTGIRWWRSQNHSPSLPAEQERLEKAGAVVANDRVWLTGGLTSLGLAISRSIGDSAAKTVGVIARPDISHLDVPDDCYSIIITVCSDGISDVIDLNYFHTKILTPLLTDDYNLRFQSTMTTTKGGQPKASEDDAVDEVTRADDLAAALAEVDRQAELQWRDEHFADDYVDDRSIAAMLLRRPKMPPPRPVVPGRRDEDGDTIMEDPGGVPT